MKLNLIAVGKRMPKWVDLALTEYIKRLPKNINFNLNEIAPEKRSRNRSLQELKKNEDEKIVAPAIRDMQNKKINVKGPFSADTIFSYKNIKLYDVVIGMYHDQVLAPIKTIFEFDAINITMGLPFLRVTPDHGPNEIMKGKNLSDPTSFIRALEFLNKQ